MLSFPFANETSVLDEHVAEIDAEDRLRGNIKFIRTHQKTIQPDRRGVVNGNLLCRVMTAAFFVVTVILVAALVFDVFFGLAVVAFGVLELRIGVDVAVAKEIHDQLVNDTTMRLSF